MKKNTKKVKKEKSWDPEVCRACLSNANNKREQNKLISLTEPSLVEMFSFCTSLQISQDDEITKNICSGCLDLLQKLYKFKNQCIESDNILRESQEKVETTVKKNIVIIKQESCEIEYDNTDIKEKGEYEDNVMNVDNFNVDDTDSDNKNTVNMKLRNKKTIKFRPKVVKVKKIPSLEVDPDFNPKNLNQNKMKTKNNGAYNCSQCPCKFVSSSRFELHKDVHILEELGYLPCNICGKKFTKLYLVRKHIKRTHSKSCSICNAVFTSIERLKSHMKSVHPVHQNDNQAICPVCGLTLRKKSSLKSHMQSHIEKKKIFKCEICSKAFCTPVLLKYHMIIHGERKFACELCDLKFHYKFGLIKHSRVHTGEKPYECHVCNKKYATAGFIKEHMRTHTGERPYVCQICTMAFVSHSRMKEHMRTHTGEKPFVCDICNHAFSQQGTMQRHRKTHNNSQPSPPKQTQSKLQPFPDT